MLFKCRSLESFHKLLSAFFQRLQNRNCNIYIIILILSNQSKLEIQQWSVWYYPVQLALVTCTTETIKALKISIYMFLEMFLTTFALLEPSVCSGLTPRVLVSVLCLLRSQIMEHTHLQRVYVVQLVLALCKALKTSYFNHPARPPS